VFGVAGSSDRADPSASVVRSPLAPEFAESIAGDRIAADLADGVLTVTIPKVEPPPARKIEVR